MKFGGARGLVIHNTFLEFREDLHTPLHAELHRDRAVSDLTYTKLPVKVSLSNGSGPCQVSRHRLLSKADDNESFSVLGKCRTPSTMSTFSEEEELESADETSSATSGAHMGGYVAGRTFAQTMYSKPPGLFVKPSAAAPPRADRSATVAPPGCFSSQGRHHPLLTPNIRCTFATPPEDRATSGCDLMKAKAQLRLSEHIGGTEASTVGRKASHVKESQQPVHSERKTTIMMRGIPRDWDRTTLLKFLDANGYHRMYDLVYLPVDFQNGANLGYCLVNLVDQSLALMFLNSNISIGADAVCEMSWTHPNQGLAAHVERYRNSPVMHPSVQDEYRPALFCGGFRVDFPAPTKTIKAPKVRNLRKNADP